MVAIANCTFANNKGGGATICIYQYVLLFYFILSIAVGENVTITDSYFFNNSATNGGDLQVIDTANFLQYVILQRNVFFGSQAGLGGSLYVLSANLYII